MRLVNFCKVTHYNLIIKNIFNLYRDLNTLGRKLLTIPLIEAVGKLITDAVSIAVASAAFECDFNY
jgi:hypothetical protein